MAKTTIVDIQSTVRMKLLVSSPDDRPPLIASNLDVRGVSAMLKRVLSKIDRSDLPYPDCLVENVELEDTFAGLRDSEGSDG